MDEEIPTAAVTLSGDDDAYWVIAHEHGMRIYHDVAGARQWLDRCGSVNAEDTLNENGWSRISPWRRDSDESLWSCFVHRIEDSEE